MDGMLERMTELLQNMRTTECENAMMSDTMLEHWKDRWIVGKNDRKNVFD